MPIGAAHGKAHPAPAQMGHTPPSADWTTIGWRQGVKEKLEDGDLSCPSSPTRRPSTWSVPAYEALTSVRMHQRQVVEVHPGQKAQPFHRDDALWPIREEYLGSILDHLKTNG